VAEQGVAVLQQFVQKYQSEKRRQCFGEKTNENTERFWSKFYDF
jgi:hypothetical protein